MVAISLYKGNLHKVSNVPPRKWVMPHHQISLKDFKTLLRRRNRALSRYLSAATATDNAATVSSDNPNPNSEIPQLKEEVVEDEKAPAEKADLEGGDGLGKIKAEVMTDSVENEINHQVGDRDDTVVVVKNEENDVVEDQLVVKIEEKGDDEIQINPNVEIQESDKEDAESSKDKRKKEVEDKLNILKEKKHSLVQALKQILNAEEELKRRSMQGTVGRSSVPLHVDIPNDTGSMTRLNTPRMGSDGVLIGEVEGGETDGMSHQNADIRHLLHMSSQSPSSDSYHKKLANNAIPHSARTTLGAIGSPSRFAPTPTAQQGHPSNLPTVSVSGTNYVASSPSPAASGGTSVFRESQTITSPWN